MLKGLLFGLLAVSLLLINPGEAEVTEFDAQIANREINTVGNGEYAITSYRIEIVVNENNTFFVKEYITAHFNTDKHGIVRKIPLRNEGVRLVGKKPVNRAIITDVEVEGDQYSVFNEDDYLVIKIGDPDATITGSRDYIVSYLCSIGMDPGIGYDEFYFNLIGYEWDTTVSGVEFQITMPKEFDESKLNFSSRVPGSTDNGCISYVVKDTVITGIFNGVLNANEALTIRLELPDGYFVGAGNDSDLMKILTIILPIVFVGLAFFIVVQIREGRRRY